MEALIDQRAAADLVEHFNAVQKHVPLRPVRSEADYDAAVASLNGPLDAAAGDEAHPLANLAATLGELIGVPSRGAFEPSQLRGLIALPTHEEIGVVVVHPDPEGHLDFDEFLGPMKGLLADIDLGGFSATLGVNLRF